MKVTFIQSNNSLNFKKIRLFFKNIAGNIVQIDVRMGEIVFSETNILTNSLRIYQRKGIIKIEEIEKPEHLKYYVGYNENQINNYKSPAVKTTEIDENTTPETTETPPETTEKPVNDSEGDITKETGETPPETTEIPINDSENKTESETKKTKSPVKKATKKTTKKKRRGRPKKRGRKKGSKNKTSKKTVNK